MSNNERFCRFMVWLNAAMIVFFAVSAVGQATLGKLWSVGLDVLLAALCGYWLREWHGLRKEAQSTERSEVPS